MKKSATTKSARKTDVRLLPAVIGVGAILFALKTGGLAFSANAAPATPAPAAAPAKAPAATPANGAPAAKTPGDPLAAINAAMPVPAAKTAPAPAAGAAADLSDSLPPELSGTGVSSAAMDVLTSLADRRDVLEQRQRDLDLRANVITAAEKRVDDKIVQLKALQAQIEGLLGQRAQQETAQLDTLVKVYTAMKPKDAARIFAALDGEVRLGVAARMKPDVMAGVLAALPPDVAQKMTVELAGRYKLPAQTAAAAAAATAPAPAPATPAAPAATAPNAAATPTAANPTTASAAAPGAVKAPGG